MLNVGKSRFKLCSPQMSAYHMCSLKSRHIQFIALGILRFKRVQMERRLTIVGGTIGTGLFLGIGRAFANAGPLSVLLGYTFTGVAIFGMMQCLGEMSTWLPRKDFQLLTLMGYARAPWALCTDES